NTVNAEGTLLCKVCGNNLRDQRMIRLTADQAMDLEHTGRGRRTWVSGILFVLAVVLIISTLLNQEIIVNWMVGVPGAEPAGGVALWRGQYDDVFDEMMDDLAEAGITEEV